MNIEEVFLFCYFIKALSQEKAHPFKPINLAVLGLCVLLSEIGGMQLRMKTLGIYNLNLLYSEHIA